jgi:hypothetical protein
MPYKDPEKQKEYDRQRYLKNKEKMKENSLDNYYADRQKKLDYLKQYREENKDKIRERNRVYNKTERGKRVNTIGGWRNKGLIADDYDAIYDRYINTHECDCCKKPIHQGIGSRVMDHCHKTGKFRNVLCHNCNILRFHLDNNYQAYLRMMTL